MIGLPHAGDPVRVPARQVGGDVHGLSAPGNPEARLPNFNCWDSWAMTIMVPLCHSAKLNWLVTSVNPRVSSLFSSFIYERGTLPDCLSLFEVDASIWISSHKLYLVRDWQILSVDMLLDTLEGIGKTFASG